MLHVDDGTMAGFLTDAGRRITDAHLSAVCRKGRFPEQCRYVATTPHGCWCAKLTPLRARLDAAVAGCSGGARGDNCPGLGD